LISGSYQIIPFENEYVGDFFWSADSSKLVILTGIHTGVYGKDNISIKSYSLTTKKLLPIFTSEGYCINIDYPIDNQRLVFSESSFFSRENPEHWYFYSWSLGQIIPINPDPQE
jgi:hypothetical protein